jgi:hypothetical protein
MTAGSVWRIWDFHLHTPHSVLNNHFGDPEKDSTWEEYVERIEKVTSEKGIAAVGVTDYFNIDGYKKLLDQKSQGRLEEVMIFPNIEFRVDQVIYRADKSSDPKRLNFHVIFSPDVPPEEIEEHFLHDLDFVHEQEPFTEENVRKLKNSNLVEFGKSLQEQHEPFKDMEPMYVAAMTATVRVRDIKEALKRFSGSHLLVLAKEDLSLLEWDEQHHAVRKQLVQMSHALFSSNLNTREFCLGLKHESLGSYLEEFKSPKPCLWGCDSHGYKERFLEPNEERYCWIKGDVTWEGLKQVVYEPEARVAIQKDSPEPLKSMYTLKSINISQTRINDRLGLDNLSSRLNPNLIAIIGGRGSGKTALLDLIASCFREGEKLMEMEDSFVNRVYGKEPGVEEREGSPVQIELEFMEGTTFSKSVGEDSEVFEEANILYLTQNHFDEYSSDPTRLNEHLVDLVFEQFREEKAEYDQLSSEVNELEMQIEHANLEHEQLLNQVRDGLEPEKDNLKELVGELKDLESKIEDLKAKEGEADEATQELADKSESLKSRRAHGRTASEGIGRILAHIENFTAAYDSEKEEINNSLDAFRENQENMGLEDLPSEIKGIADLELSLEETIELVDNELENICRQLEELREEIDALEGLEKIRANLAEERATIKTEIVDAEKRIEDLEEKKVAAEDIRNRRTEFVASLMYVVARQSHFLQSMIEKFREGSPEGLANIEFDAAVDFRRFDEYVKIIGAKVDNRSHSLEAISEMFRIWAERLQELMMRSPGEEEFAKIASGIEEEGKKLKPISAISQSELDNSLYRRFYGVGLKVSYSGTRLRDLSMGERAIVLLKVLLALGDRPLLIDQPEEHLDNRFIFDDLTPSFREAKNHRQIFIATHNANLVVNTDSEQIIMADHKGGNLCYSIGTLENLEIREDIKNILEGGDEAFKLREKKYGYVF